MSRKELTVLSWCEITDELAKAMRKWVLYLSCSNAADDPLEAIPGLRDAAPIGLSDSQIMELYLGQIWITFDNEADALAAFGRVVGDDGPTKTNPYDGPTRVYAMLSGPAGGITENT